ncbi:hypothetical protein PPTG_24079 [Phytophthora nicotianae INRA-310]|uniref:Uncharacterized protein n=1 Tax=Phytophthora nicotianae (strain INRA-310) TaxID=761204 RepID=W2PM99_PHYN3|nr:hypothetical protein PPTG_24079 [Phytophthora nicotianae INRA-310]ETN01364.1 hypothetical protein PPTG_24079 [Phytophthora nicotianae INRA-310]
MLVGHTVSVSIVYHYTYLKEYLPEELPIFQAPLMQNKQKIQELKKFIICDEASSEETITVTGVPLHVVSLSELQSWSSYNARDSTMVLVKLLRVSA